ncbi:MAG TPA: YkgJ family cysteine cluster protein [Gemmataceae bacterium]|jgi:Fe-S-cluster containining protein|nr:YkgJ family cysteine cluster protein [Gemmataceae bacterium]
MSPTTPNPPQGVACEFRIEGEGFQMATRVTVPAEPITVTDMLPLARAIADVVVSKTCQTIAAAGEPISCAKGCGACCTYLVAISEVEARRIRAVIDALPGSRRAEIRARFAAAHARLEKAGLLRRLRKADRWTEDEYETLVGAYHAVGIPCPFLEDGSCSIYEERPITCREYLVTSPPEHCADPTSTSVRRLKLPLKVFNAVARWQVKPLKHMNERWVPLIVAPEWAAKHPNDPPPVPGPELLNDLLKHLRDERPAADG